MAETDPVPPPATAAGKRQRQKETATYVLQVAYEVETPGEGDEVKVDTAWFDVRTVTVSAGTKRATVRQRALAEADIMPPLGAPALRTRLLDEDSSEETPVESELQLRIGGAS